MKFVLVAGFSVVALVVAGCNCTRPSATYAAVAAPLPAYAPAPTYAPAPPPTQPVSQNWNTLEK